MKYIELTKGYKAIVDDEDYDWLIKFNWHINNSGYAITNKRLNKDKRTVILMHRLIIKAKKGTLSDHINRNRLDNRKCNLRIVTRTQNAINRNIQTNNTSGYIGVSFNNRDEFWVAHIKQQFIGNFTKARWAAMARDVWAKEHFKGELVTLNFQPICN